MEVAPESYKWVNVLEWILLIMLVFLALLIQSLPNVHSDSKKPDPKNLTDQIGSWTMQQPILEQQHHHPAQCDHHHNSEEGHGDV